jgi:hypothetical protein
MTKPLLARVGLSVVLAVPAALGLLFVMSIVTCGAIGPWGGALERPPGQQTIEFNKGLLVLLNLMLIIGPLLIGWLWAGRILARRNGTHVNVHDDAGT